ncbi:MAG TPA: ABC transporter permease [Bacillales bacterium]|nr:ABC transporter permease [Bacillales bacterium]
MIHVFPPYLLPAPSVVFHTLLDLAEKGTLWGHIGITLFRVILGFIIGSIAALFFGTINGLNKKMEVLFDPLFQAFRSIPSMAWVPLFILWFSIGETSKVLLITVGVFFPVYLNVVSGIHGIDRKLVEVGKMYGFSQLQLVRRIIFPSAMPSVLTGLRGGLGLGWMFVVAAEIMGSSKGLGYLLVVGQNSYNPSMIIASIVLFAILGKLTDALLKRLEAKTLHWQDGLQRG